MLRDGFSKKEIASRLEISNQKLSSLIKKLNEESDELSYIKMLTEYQVEDALLKKAIGTTVTEVKETSKPSGTELVTITKDVLPDTSALQFWLKNKCPEKWSDKGVSFTNTEELLNKIFDSISDNADKCFDE